MRRIVLALSLCLGFAGCFNPDQPPCSFVCGATAPTCPDDYECRSDNYCHRVGSTDSCNFSDAAVAPLDLSATPSDLVTTTTDLSSQD